MNMNSIMQKAKDLCHFAQEEIRNDPAAALLAILILMVSTDVLLLAVVL